MDWLRLFTLSRAALGGVKSNQSKYSGGYSGNNVKNPYSMDVNGKKENINWLLD